jgi:dihydroflavonol-4-reductase
MTGLVLITGGSGYIASYCIREAIACGWRVRTSVRSLRRETEVRAALAMPEAADGRLSFCEADLTADAGWAAACDGVDAVMHVASPIPSRTPKTDDEVVAPARDGALRVLAAAKAAGARRVVMTSSTAAITYGTDRSDEKIFTEADWTDPTHPDTSAYVRSKTIAERAAWDWLARSGEGLELVTINPAAVLGPVLGKDFSPSLEIVRKLMMGAMPAAPRLGFPLVDVRDLAALHVRALTHEGVSGERFLAGGAFYWLSEIAAVLKARLGPRAAKVPSGTLPDWLVGLVKLVDPEVASVAFEIGRRRSISAAKAERVFGWKTRDEAETIVDTAESLIAARLV